MSVQESKAGYLNMRSVSLPRERTQIAGPELPVSVVVFGRLGGDDDSRRAAFEKFIASVVSEDPSLPRRDNSAALRNWVLGSLVYRVRRIRLIVAVGLGPLALLSCLLRWVSRRATLLVYVSEPPPKPLRWSARRILQIADGILVDGDAAGLVVSGLGHAVYRITLGHAPDQCALTVPMRSPEQVRRIHVVGDLTPNSGAYDLLANVAAWSKANADQTVELNLIGEGDLSAMLAAQPLPGNLSQVFHGTLGAREIAALFEQGGMLAVPAITDPAIPAITGAATTGEVQGHVAQALAAGLPVVGSRRSSEVRRHVTDGVTGWLFDPLQPGDMLDAITRAFVTSEDRLVEMRLRARAAMSAPSSRATVARIVRRTRHPTVGIHSAARISP